MALPVVVVASGGLPVVDVTSTNIGVGLPVSNATNGRGIPVTIVPSPLGVPSLPAMAISFRAP